MLLVRPVQRTSHELCSWLTLCKTLKQDFGIFSTHPSRPLLGRPAMPQKDPHGPWVSLWAHTIYPCAVFPFFNKMKNVPTLTFEESVVFAFQERFFLEPLKLHFQSHIRGSKGREVAWDGFLTSPRAAAFLQAHLRLAPLKANPHSSFSLPLAPEPCPDALRWRDPCS